MIVVGFDAIHLNVNKLPAGAQVAGYTTGSANIKWTDADWKKFPTAVRIDQDGATDPSADVLDVEGGAATPAQCPGWVERARTDFIKVKRPGQRQPVIYTSAVNVTNVANALVNGGVKSGVGLWVANWDLSQAQAISDVQSASGPFPIVAVQYSNGKFYDYDIFGQQWLSTVSGLARNPVGGLQVIRRGFTSITIGWDGQPAATGYTVKVFHRGEMVSDTDVTTPQIRVGHLHTRNTYTFRIRAHPGGSAGSDAEIKATTR